MYLLNPFCVTVSMSVPVYLRSTMYLLNPFDIETSKVNNKFTFHYVSIKSRSFDLGTLKANVFTFHYVSIKSNIPLVKCAENLRFTFHYVSIKSLTVRVS